MRNIADKQDNVDTLSAAEFNSSIMQELENSVTPTGISLDPAEGPDTDNEMLAQAMTRTAQGVMSYQDSGTANSYVLSAIGGFVQPSAYFDGMIVSFKAGNTNTGASTINVETIGVVDLKDSAGGALSSGDISANINYFAQYNATETEFRIIFSQAVSSSDFSTGDAKLTIKSTADTGWVIMDDGTIGSAASMATTRANADTEDLYTLLWNNVSDTYAPVNGGRGASAAADFADDKTIALTKVLGRALGVAGSGSGLTTRALGEYIGEEEHQLTVSEMPSHNHTYDKSETEDKLEGGTVGGADTYTSTSTSSTGGDNAHNNMQPTSFWNIMIKL